MHKHPTIWQLFDLEGKVFLVTGGARNLGLDMARALAEAHADGVVTSRDRAACEAAARELSEESNRKIVGYPLDATNEAVIEQLVQNVVREFGRVDILVNNVGGGSGTTGPSRLEERDLQAWENMQRTNVTSLFLLCKHVIPIMKGQRAGSIINIASVAGLVGRDRRVYRGGIIPQPLDYAAAKAAVIGFTRDLAAYVGESGIRVNSISPGGFERGQPQEFIDAYREKCMLKRMGRDGVDLKGAVVFLASEASGHVTGHNLVIDGGFTAWQ